MKTTKQPKLPQAKNIKPRPIEQEMQESYLDYAMSVIVSRALPDLRDGLKPVHRRILYAAHTMGLRPTAKFRKSAALVGEVLAKYHPHGDVAVYDSLVRMAQDFSMRYPLVDGQGNFGSLDGDSAAAMRYTEVRMTRLAEEFLTDIEKETVDLTDNYDATQQEPTVLPSMLPNLLLNGSTGIAVGMATNIPPHNLGELSDAIIYLIDNPDSSVDDLMAFVKGPDFPTGGIIYGQDDIRAAYSTGRGGITVRAVTKIESHQKNFRIIVSQIPYQVNKAELITKIADLVKEKRVEGISDIRDESDRKEGVRIVVELKANAYPKKVLNRLFELTPLQTVFHINLLALVDNGLQPRVLNVKEALKGFIEHRQLVVTRRTRFELARAKERAHILEGLKTALDQIDAIIELIKKSRDRAEAQANLIKRFRLTETQANAILDMRLSALASLERQRVEDELKEKRMQIERLTAILADPKEILAIIREETNNLKQRFADERRTQVIKQRIGQFTVEDLVPNEQVIVTLTRGNYIKRVNETTFRAQARGGKGVVGMEVREEDIVDHLVTAWAHNPIYFFTDRGKVYSARVYDLPVASRTSKGVAIANIIQLAPDERVTAVLTTGANQKPDGDQQSYFFMATKNGTVKKTLVSQYTNIRQTGIIAIKLVPGDELRFVKLTGGNDSIMLVSRLAQGIFFKEANVRAMGRSAAGVRGLKLRHQDELISMDIVAPADLDRSSLLTVLENGFGKRSEIKKHFHPQNRGGLGVRVARITPKTGLVVGSMVTGDQAADLVIVSRSGQVIRISLKSVKKLSRDTQGVTLMRLNKGDKIASVGLIEKETAA